MHPYVSRQARVPAGALAIKNLVGTAPGVIIDYNDKTIVALPGPPRELTPIFEDAVIPYLKKRYKTSDVDYLDGITIRYKDWWFNCRPSNTEALLRLNVEAKKKDLLRTKLKEIESILGKPL